MSRSFKHTPGWVDRKDKRLKRYANKVVRHTDNIPNGRAYRKLFQTYDICDYAFLIFGKDDCEYRYSNNELMSYKKVKKAHTK